MRWIDIDIEWTSLHGLLSTWAAQRPETNVLIFEGMDIFAGRYEEYTFRQMNELANRFANALIELGIKKGERVAIYLPNCPEFVIAYLGILKAGAAMVPVSPIHTEREITYVLADAGCVAVVTSSLFAANVNRDQLPLLREVILIDEQEGFLSFYEIIREAPEGEPGLPVDVMNDIALIPYTSGTTGIPKGAPHTHYESTWNLREALKHYRFEDEGVMLTTTPMFHVTGYHDTFGLGLFAGISTVLMERFDPEKILRLIQKHRVTHTLIPTPGLIYLMNVLEKEKFDLSSLQNVSSGGAAVPQEVGRAFSSAFDVDLVEGYGSTEALITNLNPLSQFGEIKFGSVGIRLNDSEKIVIKIVDAKEGSEEKEQGEVGEIIVKSPSVCREYLNKPEDTREFLRDGFWYSGDIGYIDEDGYLFIVDRKKAMINVSGFKCWPREVEEVIFTYPKVSDVVVIGKADPIKGEVPVAFIALKPGEEAEPADIKGYLEDKLAKYKIPVEFIFMDRLPKTSHGKTQKDELTRILRERESE
jgi:long-chain acyl-CoA synthetase